MKPAASAPPSVLQPHAAALPVTAAAALHGSAASASLALKSREQRQRVDIDLAGLRPASKSASPRPGCEAEGRLTSRLF